MKKLLSCWRKPAANFIPKKLGYQPKNIFFYPCMLPLLSSSTSPSDVVHFWPIRGKKLSHTDKLTQNQHTVRPCSTSKRLQKKNVYCFLNESSLKSYRIGLIFKIWISISVFGLDFLSFRLWRNKANTKARFFYAMDLFLRCKDTYRQKYIQQQKRCCSWEKPVINLPLKCLLWRFVRETTVPACYPIQNTAKSRSA